MNTLEAFAGKRAGNYCTLPRIDVEIAQRARVGYVPSYVAALGFAS